MRVWVSGLKREDLAHTGGHKINNALGQILLARKMGKKRIVAETGAGQHGVATATVAARFGLECVIYMGRVDMERQAPNVRRGSAARVGGRLPAMPSEGGLEDRFSRIADHSVGENRVD